MSKGPGKQQEGILRALREKDSWTAEGLRWELFEKSGGTLTEDGRLPPTWNTSFSRAVGKLGEGGRIEIVSRCLETFAECVEHYPGKTLKAEARRLRQQLLPALLEWTQEKGGAGPKYGAAQNEEHNMRSLLPDALRQLEGEWSLLEERLRPIYGSAPCDKAFPILSLICKGRSLFWSHDVSASGSLGGWIEATCAGGMLPEDLVVDLQDFQERFIPRGTAAFLKFKSIIHLFADVPRHGQCSLRTDTLQYLHDRRSAVVTPMATQKRGQFPTIYNPHPVEFVYESKLVHLFDQSVFQEFDFIHLPGRG
jgi:hypothetical protein